MYRSLMIAVAVADFIGSALSRVSLAVQVASMGAEDKAVSVRTAKADAKLQAAYDAQRRAELNLARANSAVEDAHKAHDVEINAVFNDHGYVI